MKNNSVLLFKAKANSYPTNTNPSPPCYSSAEPFYGQLASPYCSVSPCGQRPCLPPCAAPLPTPPLESPCAPTPPASYIPIPYSTPPWSIPCQDLTCSAPDQSPCPAPCAQPPSPCPAPCSPQQTSCPSPFTPQSSCSSPSCATTSSNTLPLDVYKLISSLALPCKPSLCPPKPSKIPLPLLRPKSSLALLKLLFLLTPKTPYSCTPPPRPCRPCRPCRPRFESSSSSFAANPISFPSLTKGPSTAYRY